MTFAAEKPGEILSQDAQGRVLVSRERREMLLEQYDRSVTLCFTRRLRNKLPLHPELKTVSPDIDFFELRVTGEARVHGFRVIDGFYLVWLDREHEIYKM